MRASGVTPPSDGLGVGHDDDGGGAVVQGAAVAGRDESVRAKHRLELRDRLIGHARPGTVVLDRATGPLLGPDAVQVAVERFGRLGSEVIVRPSPWRLGAPEAELAAEWFTGWMGAARDQQVELVAETGAYARRRLDQAAAGELEVTVDHADLLVLPG